MKKFLLLLYGVAMLVTMAMPVKGQIAIIGEQVVSCPNTKATVEVSVENFNNVQSAQFGVSWDTSIIKFSAFTPNLPPTVIPPNPANAANGFYYFSWFDAIAPPGDYPPGGNAVIFTMEFDVVGTYGESSLVTIGDLPGFDVEIFLTDFSILGSGDVSITNGQVMVDDVTPPLILNCPSSQVITVPSGQMSSVATWVEPDTTDNCEIATLTSTHMSGQSFPLGTTTVTYTATDVNGNSNNVPCSFDITVQQAAGSPNALTFSALGTDLTCGDTMVSVPIIVENFEDMTIVDLGLQWDPMVLDYCGYTDSINTNGNPSALYNDNDSLNGRFIFSWFDFSFSGVTLADSSTIFVLHFKLIDTSAVPTTVEITSLPGFALDFWNTSGQINVGDVSINNATIDIVPDENPNIDGGCPGRTVYADADCSVPLPNYIDSLSFSDDCTALMDLVFNQTPDSLTTEISSNTTVTVTVTDEAGNDSTCMFMVTFLDTIPPSITCPATVNTTTNTDCTATGVNLGTASVTDNCPMPTVTNDAPTAFPRGSTTVTYTATDASGNTATCTQTVTVTDDDPPMISCPVSVAAATNDGCTATGVVLGNATATDNCSPPDAAPTISNDAPAAFPLGMTTVTYTATDGAGLMATCTQEVVVTDDDPPTITCPANVSVTTDTDCTATNVVLGTPVATDNCTAPTITNDEPSVFQLGTTTVTHTATDGAGLTATCPQIVTVTDDDPPVIVCPAGVSVTTNNGCTATGVFLGTATSTDNCAPPNMDPVISNDAPVAFPLGMTTVTYTATASDGTGLTATCTQTVTVADDDPPTITCPADLTIAINANCQATMDDYISMATFSDNCSMAANITVVQDPVSGTVISTDTDVTLTATDEAGNSAECSFKVIIDDQTAPTALCFADTTVYLDAMGAVAIDETYVNNGSSDNCPNITIAIDQNSFNCSDIGDNTVTLTVTDASGNDATCMTNVIIADTIPPQLIECVPDTFLLADANCEAVLPDFTALAVFSDNCTSPGDLKITQVPPGGSTIFNDTTVAVVALDSVGIISDTCFFLVELVDTVPPSITCSADIIVDAGLDSCGRTVNWSAPTTTDNCGVGMITCDPVSGTFFPVGDSTVTCIVTDASNNADTCMFTVTVNDTQAPFLDCPSDTIIIVPSGIADTMIFDIGPDSLSDNCGVDTLFHNFTGAMMGGGAGDASGTSFVPGETTVTYTAEDASGNTQSCSFIVNILQSVIIDLDCPSDYSVPTDAGQCSAIVNTDVPSADPVAGVDTIYYVLTDATTGSGPDSVPDDQVFNIRTTTVTYTAVSITNDTSTCSFTVTVTDNEAPVISCSASSISVDNTTDSCGVVFDTNLQLASATDNCPGVQVTYSIASGALVQVGTTTITATATDQANLVSTCSYQLIVRDTQPPVISPCPADIIVNNDPGICGAAVTWTPPTATDNCGVLFIEPTPYEPGDVIPVGTEFITYTASDNAGNITECIFSITVRDNEPPSLAPCPGNITVSNDPGECSAVVSWPFIQPNDNCNVVSFVVLPQSGSVFPIGNTPVQAVATDASSNVTVCSFTVTVNDTEFPTMNNFPGNITVNNDPGICGAVVNWSAIQVDDNCGVDTFYCNMNSGDMFPAGMTNVECTVIDENGNAVTQDFTVTVIDNEPPQLSCPQDILILVDGSVVSDPSNFIDDFQAVGCDSAVLNYNSLAATDNCAIASISQIVGPVSGTTFGVGQTIITYSIQDVNANEVVCSFTIDVEGVPDATAGASPNNPCEGGDVLLFTQNYSGAVYEWVDPNGMVISNEATFTLSNVTLAMSGKYEVTITFPFGCVQKADVDVNVFPNPGLSIIHNDLLCTAAGTPLVLEALDSASTNINSYEWMTPGGALYLGNPITVTAPLQGNYTVLAITANGCKDTASVFVEISIVPETPDLSGPAEACVGEPIALDGEEFSGPGIEYHWAADPDLATAGINDINNHNNEANPSVPGAYTYFFYVTQGGCISDSAEWTVVVEDFPSFDLVTNGETVCVDGTTDLIISATNTTAGLTWEIDGNCIATQVDSMFTISGINANCSGTYSVTATSSIGCSTTETINVNITDKPVAPALQVTSDTICMGGSTTLFLTNTPSGANLLCYENGMQVSCNILNNPIQPSATSEYGVQFNINGCTSDTSFITVTVEQPLNVQISIDGDITCVDGTSTVTLSTITGGASYVWDGPCGVQAGEVLPIPNIDPSCSGLYSVSVTGSLGQCLSIGELQLEVTGMLEPVTAVQQDTACEGGDVSFCAEPEILGATYTWRDPFGNIFSSERCPSTAAIQASTPYSVEVDLDGCTSSDEVLVNVLTAPDAKDETVVGIVDAPQSFNVVVNDDLTTSDYNITVVQQPANGNVSYNGNGVFTYTPDAGFRQTDIMAYEICYDDCPDLCDIAIVTILVRYPVDQCIATTVITPNEDGINDEFVVSCLELGGCPNNQLFIFNQWGDQVFEAAPYDNSWKGTYNDRDLPDGTYYFIFKCDSSSEAEKGFVVIHR